MTAIRNDGRKHFIHHHASDGEHSKFPISTLPLKTVRKKYLIIAQTDNLNVTKYGSKKLVQYNMIAQLLCVYNL